MLGFKDYDASLFMVYSVPHISQVHFYFYTELKNMKTNIGPEINKVGFFSFDEIPWNKIAFNSIAVLISKFFEIGSKNAKKQTFNLTFSKEKTGK